jgi:hypothetical protein
LSYQPGQIEDATMRREFGRLQTSLNGPQDFLELKVLYEAPARTRAGMIVYADGATWNPGSGQGIYRRNVANTLWVFLG